MAQRILIIGSPGSGKSTLARTLGERTGLPVHHLDQMFWSAGWIERPPAEFRARLAEVLAGPRWILDGNYSGTLVDRLAAADQVVLLDLSPFRCTFRLIRRVLAGYGKVRPDMAADCPERFDLGFLWYVLSFRLRVLPRIEAKLEGFTGELVWLGTPREIARFASGERLDEDVHE